jgi:hypothetical protein
MDLEHEARRVKHEKTRSTSAKVWRDATRPDLFVVGDELVIINSFKGMERNDVVWVTEYGMPGKDGRQCCPRPQQERNCDITLVRSTGSKVVDL